MTKKKEGMNKIQGAPCVAKKEDLEGTGMTIRLGTHGRQYGHLSFLLILGRQRGTWGGVGALEQFA